MLEKLLLESWSFFKEHILTISIIILPIVAPIEIITALYKYIIGSQDLASSELNISIVVYFIFYPIYSVAIIFYMASIITGDKFTMKILWRLGVKYWLPYIYLIILAGVVIVFGLILLILPGIFIFIRYSFSEFELLLNQKKPLDAIKSSNSENEYLIKINIPGNINSINPKNITTPARIIK